VCRLNISLVSYTINGEKIVAIASKMSRSRKGWKHHEENMTEKEIETWITDAIVHGYWSPLEHSNYTFSIENISRVSSHQLVRHRIASFTQMSHRFAKPIDEFYQPIIPPSVEKRAKNLTENVYNEIYSYYYELLKNGIPEEDARYILPNGVNTNIVVTMNARELYNFFSLRLCSRSQWEIRKIAWAMLDEVKKVHPILFKYASPSCLIHENFIRENPMTLEKLGTFVSERCIEGVSRDNIVKCINNSRGEIK